MSSPLLQIAGLRVRYGATEILGGVDLEMEAGEIVGVAGESGSGKTTLAMAVVRLVEHFGGHVVGKIVFEGRDVLSMTPGELRQLRGRRISLVFQDAVGALNPVGRVGAQIRDVCKAHGIYTGTEVRHRTRELLGSVQLPCDDSFLRLYPSQLSGGMAQRLVLALSLANGPRLLIADEPTSSLDVTTEAEILALFRRLRRELGLSILFISHNLAVLAGLCDRVAILRRGAIVEFAPTRQLFESPQHPYTRLLLSSIPEIPFDTHLHC
jgi:ABC-type dipeptide/oligopeptide/nickel transport system ATPase component